MVLRESLARNEAQLQKLLRDNPGLLPLEDLGLVGPPMVVGKETAVPSGGIDLVLVARGGELILVEFKTGPQNPDFRAALAQLLDYGSDLWQLSWEGFERTVALRFFSSQEAIGTPYEGCRSIHDAMAITWKDQPLGAEEVEAFVDRLTADLSDGSFTYVVAAQRFTEPMQRTVSYLNTMHHGSSFALVEMVRFTDGSEASEEVFEARTVLRPPPARVQGPRSARLDRDQLMERLGEGAYADAIARLLDEVEAIGLVITWGTAGISIRRPNSAGFQPASVAWINPPGVSGWMGLTHLALGFDTSSDGYPPAKEALETYLAHVEAIDGGSPVSGANLRAQTFAPQAVVEHLPQILTAIGTLATAQAPPDVA